MLARRSERSRKGVGDFRLTERVRGYWDQGGTELDLVALDEERRVLRLGSCKRDAERHPDDLERFEGHVGRFLRGHPRFEGWRHELVVLAPVHTAATRAWARSRGVIAEDLADLTHGL